VKKKDLLVSKIPEFWYGRRKILVKKKDLLVCKIPKFWYGHGKILVKKNYTPSVKKNFEIFFFFSKTLNFGMVAVKFW
jgi:hypothetical protein